MLNDTNHNQNYKNNLEKAIHFATESSAFSIMNIIRNSKNVCIFGLGRFFNEAFEQHEIKKNFNVNILSDNNSEKWGKKYKTTDGDELSIISPLELSKLSNVIVIILIGDFLPVYKQLIEMGLRCYQYHQVRFELLAEKSEGNNFEINKLLESFDLLYDDFSKKVFYNVICNRIVPEYSECYYDGLCSDGEYFNHGCFKLSESESYVDCGAYDGDTIIRFLKYTNGYYKNIYAFDIDLINFEKLQNRIKGINKDNKIKCFNLGVWNENTELNYGNEEKSSRESFSVYKNDNLKRNKVVKMDDTLKNNEISLIKMDIEGSEFNALKGAENIIKTQKPKLAISIYHKMSDFWEIPIYLKSLVPEYKFYIRHHQPLFWGTVLYADV